MALSKGENILGHFKRSTESHVRSCHLAVSFGTAFKLTRCWHLQGTLQSVPPDKAPREPSPQRASPRQNEALKKPLERPFLSGSTALRHFEGDEGHVVAATASLATAAARRSCLHLSLDVSRYPNQWPAAPEPPPRPPEPGGALLRCERHVRTASHEVCGGAGRGGNGSKGPQQRAGVPRHVAGALKEMT